MTKQSSAARARVAAYCRVSTEKDDQLLSLQAQIAFFEEYADKHNLELVHVYADEGISGCKLKNRKDFNRMMRDAEHGLFEHLFVKDVSRLARNVVDFLQSVRRLKTLNINCQFITSNMSLNDGELTLTILAAVAQEESANLSKRVKFGKKKNAENGRVPNIVYGYDKVKDNYFELQINTFEASVIKRIYDMYIGEGYGANKISKLLNKEGLQTKRGCKWTQCAVARILSNPLYTGKIINCKEYISDFLTGTRMENEPGNWQVVDKPEFAIIGKEEFNKAQIIAKSRVNTFKSYKKRHSNQYPLSTLIQCKNCGYSFRRTYRKYMNEYIRWTCGGRNKNGVSFCENAVTVDEEKLLAEIRNYIKSLVSSKDKLLDRTIAEFKKKYQPGRYDIDEHTLTEELARLKKAKAKQMQMFEADVITMQELKERTSELNASIEKYNNQLAAIRGSTGMYNRLEAAVKKYCGSINDVLSAEIINNVMLKKVIDKITVSPSGEIKIYLKLFSDLDLEHSFDL